MLIKDMVPLLVMLGLTALAGFIFLRVMSQEVRKWREGRYYRIYQLSLWVVLLYYGVRLVYILTHARHGAQP